MLTCHSFTEDIANAIRLFPRTAGRAAIFMVLATFFYGCATNRGGHDVPKMPLPAEYRNTLAGKPSTSGPAVGGPAAGTVSSDSSQHNGIVEWWRSFGSIELVELIDRGLSNNQDVRIYTLRLAQAKAREVQARAGLMPTITAPIGEAIQAPGGQIGAVPVGSADRTTQRTYQSSVRGNWRVDVWGEQRSLAESARFQLWQAAFDRDNVQRNMTANLASAYVEFLSLNDRLRVARETEAVLGNMLATIEKRVDVPSRQASVDGLTPRSCRSRL